MRVLLRILIALLLLGVLAAAGAGAYGYHRLEAYKAAPVGQTGESKVVVIPKGAHLGKIARLLASEGIVDEARWLELYGRHVRKVGAGLKAGEFEVSATMTPDALLDHLLSGKVKTYKVTIPEGFNVWEVSQALEAAGLAKAAEFLAYVRKPSSAQALGVGPKKAAQDAGSAPGLEGYLYPDTYFFARGRSVQEIAQAMVRRFEATFDEALAARAKALGMTRHEVVTLAAIIEKETGAAEERPRISAVFHNRMKLDMKLQTDPTVIYAAILATGGNFDGNIKRSDLRREHPYNTYTMKGLPPGPIANPGRAALLAAVQPIESDELFFVSRNDGTHVFCPTLKCHNAAVEKWQRQYFRRKRAAARAKD